MPASCDGCTKQLWAPFRPPPAVECRRCRAKFHREHVVQTGNNQVPISQITVHVDDSKKAIAFYYIKKEVSSLLKRISFFSSVALTCVEINFRSARA